MVAFALIGAFLPVLLSDGARGQCNNPYGCAHPSYPTGSQSHQPNDGPCANPFGCGRGQAAPPYPPGRDVYCQQSPGQPMYGPYHGTGTQTPCGPDFGRLPARPALPKAPTPCSFNLGLNDQADGPVRLASLSNSGSSVGAPYSGRAGLSGRPALALPVQLPQSGSTAGLTIGGRKVNPGSDQDYRCIVKFLTVPQLRQTDPAFTGDNLPAIKAQLEDPLRRQIVDAMAGNPIAFRFTSVDSANENIDIRIEAISFMRSISSFPGNLQCGFTGGKPGILNSLWQAQQLSQQDIAAGFNAPAGLVLDSAPGATADAAIQAFRSSFARLDCLGGVELVLFEAVDKVIGPSRFDAEHPEGLQKIGLNVPNPPLDNAADDSPTSTGAWNGISVFKNVRVFLGPTFSMMVPGDWAYMRNDPNYQGGAWMGENTIYMGKYYMAGAYLKPSNNGYQGDQYARFSGLGGETNKTAAQLAQDLAGHFSGSPGASVSPGKIGWTMLARLKAGDGGPSSDRGPSSAEPSPPPTTGTAFDQ